MHPIGALSNDSTRPLGTVSMHPVHQPEHVSTGYAPGYAPCFNAKHSVEVNSMLMQWHSVPWAFHLRHCRRYLAWRALLFPVTTELSTGTWVPVGRLISAWNHGLCTRILVCGYWLLVLALIMSHDRTHDSMPSFSAAGNFEETLVSGNARLQETSNPAVFGLPNI